MHNANPAYLRYLRGYHFDYVQQNPSGLSKCESLFGMDIYFLILH